MTGNNKSRTQFQNSCLNRTFGNFFLHGGCYVPAGCCSAEQMKSAYVAGTVKYVFIKQMCYRLHDHFFNNLNIPMIIYFLKRWGYSS